MFPEDTSALEPVGEGSVGKVYRYARGPNEVYAIKVLRPELRVHKEALERFRQELAIYEKVAKSASFVVPILDSGTWEGSPYYIMPFLHHTLRKLLADKPRVFGSDGDGRTRLKLLYSIAAAVDAFHNDSLVHGDVKPTNILFDDELRPFLADFGLARNAAVGLGLHGSRDTLTIEVGQFAGTLPYMAPEQFEGAAATVESDLYALGTIAWEMIHGELPYPIHEHDTIVTYTRRKMTQYPRPPYGSKLPASVTTVLMRMLNRDPLRRFRMGFKFVDELERAWREAEDYSLEDPAPVGVYVLAGYAGLGITALMFIQHALSLWGTH